MSIVKLETQKPSDERTDLQIKDKIKDFLSVCLLKTQDLLSYIIPQTIIQGSNASMQTHPTPHGRSQHIAFC